MEAIKFYLNLLGFRELNLKQTISFFVIILKYMDEPTNPNPILPPTADISVPVGGVEGAPITIKAPEATVEVITPSEVEPVISKAEREAGVVAHLPEPILPPDAKADGVVESIPKPTFSNFPTDQNIEQQTVKTADVGTSDPWRALLVIKEFAKGLFGIKKPQEVK